MGIKVIIRSPNRIDKQFKIKLKHFWQNFLSFLSIYWLLLYFMQFVIFLLEYTLNIMLKIWHYNKLLNKTC